MAIELQELIARQREAEARFNLLDWKTRETLLLVGQEVERAEAKHPNWPADPIHAAAIVGEESGELLQATVQYTYEGGNRSAIGIEAIHTAATAVRLIKNL